MKGTQLPLPVQLRETASFASFWAGSNAGAVQTLREAHEPVLLYGPARSGRTHLLQALCRERSGHYLPLREWLDYGPGMLDGFELSPWLCLDDVDALAAHRDWQHAILRLIDQRRREQQPFVVTASAPPEHLDLIVDLRTRLAACIVLGLHALSDEDSAALLRQRAQARGLQLPDEVVRWLLRSQERSTGALLDALERLDRASLSEKRRLTLPFALAVLAR